MYDIYVVEVEQVAGRRIDGGEIDTSALHGVRLIAKTILACRVIGPARSVAVGVGQQRYFAVLLGDIHKLLGGDACVEFHIVLSAVHADITLDGHAVNTSRQVLDGLIEIESLAVGFDIMPFPAEFLHVTTCNGPAGDGSCAGIESGICVGTILSLVEVCVLHEDGEVVASGNLRSVANEVSNQLIHVALCFLQPVGGEGSFAESLADLLCPKIDGVLEVLPLTNFLKSESSSNSLCVNLLVSLIVLSGLLQLR